MHASAFRHRYGPWALVAGASEGIGEEFARQLAAAGLNLVLIARRPEPLQRLGDALQAQHGVTVRCHALDLGRPDLDQAVAAAVADLEIGLLVYNACFSTIRPFLQTDLADKLTTIDVNCRGPLALTSLLAGPMAARGRGGIVLMSSASSLQGAPLIATYAATKAFNSILAEGLWEELRPQGVDVLALVAGATRTPNFLAATPQDKQAGSFPMLPRDVVAEGLAHLQRGPRHVAGRLNRVVTTVLSRLLPRRWAVRFMGAQLRKIYLS